MSSEQLHDSDESISITDPKKTGFGAFLHSLSSYYSNFLETDFKSTRRPKRQYKERQGEMRVGIQLAQYPSFLSKLINKLDSKTNTPTPLTIKHKQFKASLSNAAQKGIHAAIGSVNTSELKQRLHSLQNDADISAKKDDIAKHFELSAEQFMQSVSKEVQNTVVQSVLDVLQPVIEGQSGEKGALDALNSYAGEITETLIAPLSDQLLDDYARLMFQKDGNALASTCDELAKTTRIQPILSRYFESFVAQDLFVQIREVLASQKLQENVTIYLNIGELNYKGGRFPLYFVPVEVAFVNDVLHLTPSSTIYCNKKLLDYVIGELAKHHKKTSTNPINERIIHKTEDQTHFDVIFGNFHQLCAAMFLEGDVDLKSTGLTEASKFGLKLTNSYTFTLSDQADEAIVTDFEQLMLASDPSDPLVLAFEEIVDAFLTEDPISVEPEIDQNWADTSTPDRLVFASPLPLAEEQRKVLKALHHDETKFISVEGPPGTGKSHTITAIAFEHILKGKNILILSDKTEALDVVEGKLNDVISKVRGKDSEYVNPLLRLGKSDSNYSNIVKRSSIEKLKSSAQQFDANRKAFEQGYNQIKANLTKNVETTVESVEAITMTEIDSYHEKEAELLEKHPSLKDVLIFDEQLHLLSNMHSSIVSHKAIFAALHALSNEQSEPEKATQQYLYFLSAIRNIKALTTELLKEFPKLDIEHTDTLAMLIDDIKEAKWPIFGYLFIGSKMRELGKTLQPIIGKYLSKPQAHLDKLVALTNLQPELSTLLSYKGFNKDELSDFMPYARIGAIDHNTEKLFNKFITTTFTNEIQSLFPTSLQGMLAIDESTLSLLSDATKLLEAKSDLKTKFDAIPAFDYLSDKSQFEKLNTLKLVSTIDKRVTDFVTHNKASAKTLQTIIRQKAKFPVEQFTVLKDAFPCMIAGLREYAEYIPLERNLFDLVIIDEASQVSIAQALPAILRAKKVLVLGDRRQFGNVKTANASKKVNQSYFNQVLETFKSEVAKDISQLTRLANFNIRASVMDFFEMSNQFSIQLKKHFRGYPEMISFSSKYVYDDGLQALKIRGKPIDDVLTFMQVPDDEQIEIYDNVNEREAELIFEQLDSLLMQEEPPSVAIITPFRAQVTYLQKRISQLELDKRDAYLKKLKLAVFTFDTCQGEERDIIFYSMVATRERDGTNYIFPKTLDLSEDEVDANLKFQRLNVGFSRGKEQLIFVLSKPIDEFGGAIRDVLKHYQRVQVNARRLPEKSKTDQNSPMEAKMLDWLKQTSFVNRHSDVLEIIPQFELGAYLKALHPTYQHPAYKVDFLLRLRAPDGGISQVIMEYDGFEYHFQTNKRNDIDLSNWQSYLTAQDVERECVLESFGYKMIRLNRFNITSDPVSMLDETLSKTFKQFGDSNKSPKVVENINETLDGLETGELKTCSRCKKAKPIKDFNDPSLKSGVGRVCKQCKRKR